MISKAIINILSPISLNDYVRSSRETGRANVDPAARAEFVSALERVALVYANAANLSFEEERLSNLVNDLWSSERPLSENPKPRYPIYTNVALLNRFIGVYSNPSVQSTWTKCRVALAIICDDWLHFERHALECHERIQGGRAADATGINFQEVNVKERIEELEILCSFLTNVERPAIPPVYAGMRSKYQIDWLSYAVEQEVALAHLTALPQSMYHDEYLFLRTLHLFEVCLWAIIVGIRAAVQSFHRSELSTTLLALKESNFFAQFLLRVLSVFRTLPVESFFDGFREATGDSSAIQSEKYQHVEILSRGLSDAKRTVLQQTVQKHKELSWLADWSPPPEASLVGLLSEVEKSTLAMAPAIRAELFTLDRSLQSWRNVHLGIARRYLPKETVGTGEQGIGYLQKHFQSPGLFDGRRPDAHDAAVVSTDDAFVSTEEFLNLRIGFIVTHDVPALKLIETADILAKQVNERLKQASDQEQNALSKLFRYYDPIFAKYSTTFPLKRQLAQVLKKGLRDPVIAKLLLSLELSTGLLMGIHDATHMQLPIRVTTATDGQHLASLNGRTLALKSGELVLVDQVRTFASYVQGPDKRTSVQLLKDPKAQIFKSLLFVVLGAPSLPEANFEAALNTVQTAAFSIAGAQPDVFLVKTRYA
ncbi:hypothetical protein AAFG07_33400 [Bradyrhizobium sp. B097]|uniref:hypothetical protein n=1 Tax=Bradyrhizobium sp. B097 TaxID=3140244 RepID=UPI0031830685